MEWTGKKLGAAMYLIGSLMIVVVSVYGCIKALGDANELWMTLLYGFFFLGILYLYTLAAAVIYDAVLEPYDDTP